MDDAQAMNEIVEYVSRTNKTIRFETSLDGSGKPMIFITNYDEDCRPLEGWVWEDENIHLVRPTLGEAWLTFKERINA